MKEIYDMNSKKILQFKLNDDHISTLEKNSKYNFSNDTIYFISLLEPFVVHYTFFGDQYYWVFGYMCHISIEKEKEFEYINMTHESIIDILSNKTIIEILNIIKKNKEIRPSELTEEMNNYGCSPSTVYRLINNLLTEKAVVVSNRDKKKVYYAINGEYFKRASVVMNDFLLYYFSN